MTEEQSTKPDEPAVEQVEAPDLVEATEPAAAPPGVQLEAEVEATPQREVIFVDAPVVPRKKGNRVVAALIAVPATLIFVVVLIALQYVISGGELDFLGQSSFYYPALFLFIGIVLLGLVLNRAGWWTYIFGSVVVAALVWFGSASLALVSAGMFSMTQPQANEFFYAHLLSGGSVIAALLAREVALWTGAVLARRGKALKVRNAEAHAAFEKQQADLMNLGK